MNCHSPLYRGKSRLFFVLRPHYHLPVSALQVKCREPRSSTQRVQGVVNPREDKKQSFFVTSFSLRNSTQKRRLRSFFWTSTTVDDHGLSDSSITPLLFMSSNRIFTSACFAKGSLRGGWRMSRTSPVSILWFNALCFKDVLIVRNDIL